MADKMPDARYTLLLNKQICFTIGKERSEMQDTDFVMDDKYIRPSKAYKAMRFIQSSGATVYINGDTGYGKTSFIKSYFAQKKYEYYSCNDIDITEMADVIGEKSKIVVLDDFQNVEETFRTEYSDLIDRLTADKEIWLIIVSRAKIPSWLKPLHIKYVFEIIDEKQFEFTEQEEELYYERWQIMPMHKTKEKIRELCNGYPLFMKICMVQLRDITADLDKNDADVRLEKEFKAIEKAREDFWDYLNAYIYDDLDAAIQEFLINICVIDKFTLHMAQIITKKSESASIIKRIQELGNFIKYEKEANEQIYYLRPVARNALMWRLFSRYSNFYINELYQNAGNCYEIIGNMVEALQMYEKCNDIEGIARILIENARRYIGIGYYWELRKYYFKLSDETIKQSPELMSGMSMLFSIMFNAEESEKWYRNLMEFSKHQSGSLKKEAKLRLSYLDIALPHRGSKNVLAAFKNAGIMMKKTKSMMPEISVTNNQPSLMNAGKDFCEWSKRDRELALLMGKVVEYVLGKFGKGMVSLSLAESLLEKGEDDYEVSSLINEGLIQAEAGGKPEMIFVAAGLMSWLSILHNRPKDAIENIKNMREGLINGTPQLNRGIDTFMVRLWLYIGRRSDIYSWMKTAPNEDMEFCIIERYHYMTKIRVYLYMGEKIKALRLLNKMLAYSQRYQRTYINMEAKILMAITQYRLKNEKWKEILQDAITMAEEYKFVRVFSREGTALIELLKDGDFVWKNEEFKKRVLKECEYMAELYPSYLKEKNEENVVLSDKAIKILRLQAEGNSIEKIADILGLSKAGVKYYNHETYKKLGVNGKAAAINEARNRQLI